MKKIDCRGLACPQPVLETKEAITATPNRVIEVTVDNEASRENVIRFLKNQGWEVRESSGGGGTFIITAAPGQCNLDFNQTSDNQENADNDSSKIMVLITTDTLGRGNDELGKKLMTNFIMTLKEMGDSLWKVVLVNGGVRLARKETDTFEPLKELENSGISILVCGTCIDFFGLMDKERAGQLTNMLDIVTSMQIATKIIQI